MPEYIEREALLNEAKKRAKAFSCALIYEAIKEAPAADVVEVVRCKDCKSCDQFYPNKKIGEEPKLDYFCKMGKHRTAADDFCSCGERSESA